MEETEESKVIQRTAPILTPFEFCDGCAEFSADAESTLTGPKIRCYHRHACMEAVNGYICQCMKPLCKED